MLSWARDALSEGQGFLRSQPGYDKIDPTWRRILSDNPEARSSRLSSVTSNRFGHIALTLASSMTDIKPFFEYQTDNDRLQHQCILANKRANSWWLTRQIDLRFLDVNKFALASGSGYNHLIYDPILDDQDMLPEDPRDVFPVRPSSMLTLQDCFGVLVRRERTMNWVKLMYPKAASQVKPDREGFLQSINRHNLLSAAVERLGLDASPFWSQVDAKRKRSGEMTMPTVDVFTLYVKDRSRNKSSFVVEVGSDEFPYKYKVKPGELLYPRMRRIIFTQSAILDDNPSPYWHGLFPLVKLTLDPWPTTWLGKAPMWDLLPLQDEFDRMMRAVSDWIQKVAQPDVVANSQAVSRAEFNKINTRLAGLKLRTNPMGGAQGVAIQGPPEMPVMFLEVMKMIVQEMDVLSGVQDISNVAKLNQLPSGETIERMMEAMTPLVRMRSRVVEAILREFAMICFSNFLQFDSLPKRLAMFGPKGLTYDDMDYDPGTMIPADLEDGTGRKLDTREERARAMLQMFQYHVAPGSLLAASEITSKMLYVQLARMGYLDNVSLLEKLQVPNIGIPPDCPEGIIPRLKWQQEQQMGMAVGPAGASASGRKASGQEAPRMVLKES